MVRSDEQVLAGHRSDGGTLALLIAWRQQAREQELHRPRDVVPLEDSVSCCELGLAAGSVT